jgi:phage terminase large subunit-like protein
VAETLADCGEAGVRRVLASLTDAEVDALRHTWSFWARPKQLLPPGDWRVALYLAGRGWGKTRVGAQAITQWVEKGKARRIALVAPTAGDARDVVVEGESGLLAVAPPWLRPTYESSKRRVTWPNGAIATLYTADEPNRLRGPQHDAAWCDELAAWRYPEAWDMLMFGLRLGSDPRVVVTTTPRPTAIVKALIARAMVSETDVRVVRGATHENRGNLPRSFFEQIVAQYEGTRLGRQELYAEILDDNPGALWTQALIDSARVTRPPVLKRVVVGVDPAVSADEHSDETGIVVVGLGDDGHGYVLDDVSGIYTPSQWARTVARVYAAHEADRVIAEVNQGGDLVEANLRACDATMAYTAVRATRGKAVRAEPVAALYERGRVHHVGNLARLEDQMCGWDPTTAERSPDRVDALVWAVTSLMLGAAYGPKVKVEQPRRTSVLTGDAGY